MCIRDRLRAFLVGPLDKAEKPAKKPLSSVPSLDLNNDQSHTADKRYKKPKTIDVFSRLDSKKRNVQRDESRQETTHEKSGRERQSPFRPVVNQRFTDNTSALSNRNPMSFVNNSNVDATRDRSQEAYKRLDGLISRWEIGGREKEHMPLVEQEKEEDEHYPEEDEEPRDVGGGVDLEESNVQEDNEELQAPNPFTTSRGPSQRYFSTMEDLYKAVP
eukprot:TRINITY_DN4332_c0_g2_i1.p1 TRINITY_DN4332_c0_g2~~TRINITY_DN4332_c0_g2_i1.p1  ORF type:complete len:237 (-),score=67.88 TRINITY_DN4332_c0_g2_i1:74-724(-)